MMNLCFICNCFYFKLFKCNLWNHIFIITLVTYYYGTISIILEPYLKLITYTLVLFFITELKLLTKCESMLFLKMLNILKYYKIQTLICNTLFIFKILIVLYTLDDEDELQSKQAVDIDLTKGFKQKKLKTNSWSNIFSLWVIPGLKINIFLNT